MVIKGCTNNPDETLEALVAAYLQARPDRLVDDVPPDLLEYFGRQELPHQVEEELERRIAAGELERVLGEWEIARKQR